ncbi:hypothetical protein [Nocardia carnea]|uniref:hypothetical protein n=1 Tax=Nocardia carnea TaxID=37328 RepID=UPI002457CB75|nr:hypothetical protein [Nocardia carnea]
MDLLWRYRPGTNPEIIGPGAIYDNFLPRPLPLGIDVAFVGEADSYDATVTITVKR